MPTGLQIINNSGTIMLDENYPGLARRYSGSVTLDGTGYGSVTKSSLTGPFLAIRCSSPVSVDSGTLVSGSTTWEFIGVPGAVVSYWLYDTPVINTGAGLQVFRADGALCFDSNNNACRYVGVRVGNTIAEWQGSYTYPGGGRTYAVVICQAAGMIEYDGYDDGQPPSEFGNWMERMRIATSVVSMTANEVTYGWRVNEWGPYNDFPMINQTPTELYPRFEALVVDVTP